MNRHIEESNYRNDHRVRAGERDKMEIDEKKMVGFVTVEDDDFVETRHEVPITFDVCPTCEGKGTHVNPSIDSNGLTADDFAEDPDFAEEYMNGSYDVTCYGCGGKRVVPVINRDRCDPELLKRLDARAEADAEFRRVQEAERRMGA